MNMILLENEASLRGDGCTAPPKTRNIGRLPNNQMVVGSIPEKHQKINWELKSTWIWAT